MGEIFRGWRRKVGLLTLLMALMSAAGWMRSTSVVDIIDYVKDRRSAFFVHSADQLLLFVWLHDNDHPFLSTIGSVALSDSDDLRLISRFRECGWKCCGFAIGDYKNNPDDLTTNIAFFLVPDWSITIPLSLISLWLLLSKPRKSIQNAVVEPIAENAA